MIKNGIANVVDQKTPTNLSNKYYLGAETTFKYNMAVWIIVWFREGILKWIGVLDCASIGNAVKLICNYDCILGRVEVDLDNEAVVHNVAVAL